MVHLKSLSALASVAAAATLVSALPAQANVETLPTATLTEVVTPDLTEPLAAETTDLGETLVEVIPTESVAEVPLAEVPMAEVPLAEIPTEGASEWVEAIPANAATTAGLLTESAIPVAFQISDEALISFDNAGLQAALNESITESAPTLDEGVELAQSSRRGYASVSPAYLGVAGNVGFGDPDSAIGDFGVNVISKISLGPRFSLRPGFFISERFTNFAIPLTYNFNVLSARGVRFQPYVGAGVDVPFNGNTALMLNAGADVPISRAFTLNAATNVRVTSGFGLGFSLGVGYNLPFVFQ
ncbi:hypothetical protein [Phormidium sp. FACHB-1136]|uniref:hypothetical protein n=1 Tax=Phormidium sp. FACHB-1136 TaxID=2692848 RepID=UPI0016868C0E|nr:hypothetical protein [Phormidium sp. FACHB-1136]MBD2426985.1 hypothetical protein [Phormidium sp. FACHB-1136]